MILGVFFFLHIFMNNSVVSRYVLCLKVFDEKMNDFFFSFFFGLLESRLFSKGRLLKDFRHVLVIM